VFVGVSCDSLRGDALHKGLRLKPFGKWLVKVLWLCQWNNSSMTSNGHESRSDHKGTAGKLQELGLIFFILVGLFGLTLFDFLAAAVATSTRFLLRRFLVVLFIR